MIDLLDKVTESMGGSSPDLWLALWVVSGAFMGIALGIAITMIMRYLGVWTFLIVAVGFLAIVCSLLFKRMATRAGQDFAMVKRTPQEPQGGKS